MAASVSAAGEVVGTCMTVPVGACDAHLIAVWDAPSPGVAVVHAAPQALACSVTRGWIDPCSKILQIKKLIMQLCHTVSSQTKTVLDIV